MKDGQNRNMVKRCLSFRMRQTYVFAERPTVHWNIMGQISALIFCFSLQQWGFFQWRTDQDFYLTMSALAAHLSPFNTKSWTVKIKWELAWLRFTPTLLFVAFRQRDNLSKLTSRILNIMYSELISYHDSEQLQSAGTFMSHRLSPGQQKTGIGGDEVDVGSQSEGLSGGLSCRRVW